MTDKAWLDASEGRNISELIGCERDYRVDSIVVAIEDRLRRKAKLNPVEAVVVAVEAMEREVNNGGFAQFFANSSCEHAPTLVAALEQLGASKTATIFQRAMNALGATSLWQPADYEAAASAAEESTLARLSECDAEYFGAAEPIADKLFAFIKLKQAEITL
jgi:hypothetical protein